MQSGATHEFYREARKSAEARVGDFVRRRWDLQYVIDADVLFNSYLAVDMNGGGLYELAFLRTDLVKHNGLPQAFLDAAEVAGRIEHPGVCKVQETGRDEEDVPYYAAGELTDCESVAQYLERRQKTIPPAEAIRIAVETLCILQAAHDKKIAHGWLEPRALLLREDGALVLRGFGFDGLRERATSALGLPITPGAAAFRAPEQLGEEPPSPEADQFSVAAILFHLLTAQCPYEGDDKEVVRRALLGSRRSLKDVEPKAPPDLVDVLERGLAFDPSERFDSAGDFAVTLRHLGEERSITLRRTLEDDPDSAAVSLRPGGSQPAMRRASSKPPPPQSIPSPQQKSRMSGAYSQVSADGTPVRRPSNNPGRKS